MDISPWHPLTVHFPIAFLSMSGLVSIYLSIQYNKKLALYNLVLLTLGVLGLLLSIYTGDQEEDKVSRLLCDPTILKDHENYAYYLLWSFISLWIFWLIKLFFFKQKSSLILLTIICLCSSVGIVILIYVGHLGASLVFQQAAGVTIPDPDCIGF